MPKGKPNAKWLKLTEEQNALDYLESAYAALRRTGRDPLAWKWVVIGLHGALYGFAICVLKGMDYTQVLDPKKSRRRPRLIDFDEALKRCQDAKYVGFHTYSKPVKLTNEQRAWIAFLKDEIRNQLEHYRPLAWSIRLQDVAVAVHHAFDVIGSLALETGNVHLSTTQRQRVQACVAKGRALVEMGQLYRDFLAATKRASRAAVP
jgi:hypothetical protein